MSRKRSVRLFALAIVAVASLLTNQVVSARGAPANFTHPGVLVSQDQLDFIRAKVNSGAQPWKAAYNQLIASSYASPSRTPKPRSVVDCGPRSMPNNGCTDEREDAIAAYTDALAWYITRNTSYATESIRLMVTAHCKTQQLQHCTRPDAHRE